MAATAAGGRPRSARGGSAKTNLAYDLGHKGEAVPEWVQDNADYLDAYEEGVSDRDYTGGADSGARPDRPPRKPAAKSADVIPINSAPSAPSPAAAPAPSSTPSILPSTRGGSSVIRATGSIGSAILGAFAYALFINVINGTGTRWLSAKWTNGDGKLP